MTFTNEEMVRNAAVLSRLRETGKLGYAVARNLRKLRGECADYVRFRDELLAKYGTPVMKDGKPTGTVAVTGDNAAKYREELGNLPDETAEVQIVTVPEEAFTGGALTSDQMEALLWMVAP